jgi:hypothetical protein
MNDKKEMPLPLQTQQLCLQYLENVRNDPDHNLSTQSRFELYRSFGPSRLDFPGYQKRGSLFNYEEYKQHRGLEFANFTIADYALSWLAVLTAERVLPIFDKIWQQIENFDPVERAATSAEQVAAKLQHEITHNELFLIALMNSSEIVPAVDVLQIAKNLLQHNISFEEAEIEYGGLYLADETVDRRATQEVGAAFMAAYEAVNFILFGPRSRIIPENEVDDSFVAAALVAYTVTDKNPPGAFAVDPGAVLINLAEMSKQIHEHGKPDPSFSMEYAEQEVIPLEYNLQKRLEFWEWWLTEAIPKAWELAGQAQLYFQK